MENLVQISEKTQNTKDHKNMAKISLVIVLPVFIINLRLITFDFLRIPDYWLTLFFLAIILSIIGLILGIKGLKSSQRTIAIIGITVNAVFLSGLFPFFLFLLLGWSSLLF